MPRFPQSPVEFGFDEASPFSTAVPEQVLSDEPWESPWDLGSVVEEVESAGVDDGGEMGCIDINVVRAPRHRPRSAVATRPLATVEPRPRSWSGEGRARRGSGGTDATSPTASRLAGLDRRRSRTASGAGRAPVARGGRRLLAACGELEDGFALRERLDYRSPGENVPAIRIGDALARRTRLYVDADGGRGVPSGDRSDACVFSVYVVDERALCDVVCSPPPTTCAAPDVRFDLEDAATDARVARLCRRLLGRPDAVWNPNRFKIPST